MPIHALLVAIAPGVDPDTLWDVALLEAGKIQDIHMVRLAWATPRK